MNIGRGFLPLLLPLLAAQEAQHPNPVPTFRTSAREVDLDLIIRDNRGRQVNNVKAEEVEIYENGVRQQIKSFRLVSGKERQQLAAPTATNRQYSTHASPAATPLPSVNYVCIVFHNVDGRTLKYALDATRQFLDREMQSGTGVALFSLGARLTPLNQFTTDRRKLLELAAESFNGPAPDFMRVSDAALNAAPYQASVAVTESGEATLTFSGGTIDPRTINGADVRTGTGDAIRRGLAADQRRAFGHIVGMQGQDQINLLLDEIGPLPGRKTVLLLSTGLATTGDLDQFRRLVDRANHSQITFYAVDVNGMGENSTGIAGNTQLSHVARLSRSQTAISTSAGVAAEKSRQGDYIEMAVRTSNTQASLRALSESTGGFLIADTEDLRKPFQRLHEEVDAHYEAVYTPVAATFDGRFRKIEVKLSRANLNVQSRLGYFAVPALGEGQELTLSDVIGLAALNSPQRPHPFDYRTAAFQFGPTPSGTQHALALEVPAASLTAAQLPAGRLRLHASVVAVVKDLFGEIVHIVRHDAPFDIAAENAAALRTSAIPFTDRIDLPPGRYAVETAVLDRHTNRVSVNSTEFESTRTKTLAISSVILVQQLQPTTGPPDPADPFQFPANGARGGRVIPSLSPGLTAGAHPLAYFVVFPNPSNPAKPKIEVDFVANGALIAKETSGLPAAGATGSIPMVIKAAAHAGECELKVTAMQGDEAASGTLRYTIAEK